MFEIGDVISYWEMCGEEKFNLQKGMNYKVHGKNSILLMSTRPGSPYSDRVEDGGKILIYEGHDCPNKNRSIDPKVIDQPMTIDNKITQNGLFFNAAQKYKKGFCDADLVKVYEKIKSGIWVYNGLFRLLDAWMEFDGKRQVFKFKLEMIEDQQTKLDISSGEDNPRMIPTSVKIEVWKRDVGKCCMCGSDNNLHFDHIIPYSKGGSSLVTTNIQILCSKCNLSKHDKIE